jgi:hypothetical protein
VPGAAAREWMAAREAELLPVSYFHVVFTLPSAIGEIAYLICSDFRFLQRDVALAANAYV